MLIFAHLLDDIQIHTGLTFHPLRKKQLPYPLVTPKSFKLRLLLLSVNMSIKHEALWVLKGPVVVKSLLTALSHHLYFFTSVYIYFDKKIEYVVKIYKCA